MQLWRQELARGRALDLAGDAEGARTAYARAHELAPAQPEPAFALGRAEERRGRPREAERLYRAALSARPAWPLAAVALARLLMTRATPTPAATVAEARQILAPARAEHPDEVLPFVVEAELLLEEERAEEAKALLTARKAAGGDVRVVDLALARAENRIGIALASEGRHDEAAFAFKRACDLDRGWAPPRANLGALWQRMGKLKQALEQYRRALTLDPRHTLAHFNLGVLLRERGDLAGAARSFERALAADPPHAQARLELALTLSADGEHRRAIALLEEELRTGQLPAATVYNNLGVARLHADDPAGAEAAFAQALEHDAAYPPALRNLAYLYGRAGRLVEAAALLQRAEGNSGAPAASK